MVSTENLFRTPTMAATSWIDRYSATTPDVKIGRIETGHGLGRIAVDRETVWVANAKSETVARIDHRDARVVGQTKLGKIPTALTVGPEGIWVLGANGWLWRVRANGEGEGLARVGRGARDLACDSRSVWILCRNGRLVTIEGATGEPTGEVKIRGRGRQLLHSDGVLLALTADGRRLYRLSTDGGQVEAEAKLPAMGIRAVVEADTLWVACGRRVSSIWGALIPIDLATMKVGAPHKLPNAPRAIAAGSGHLWVACGRRGDRKSFVVRVDPTSGRITPWAETEWTVYDLAVAGGELLAAAGLSLAGPAAGMADAGGGGGMGGGHHGGGGGGH